MVGNFYAGVIPMQNQKPTKEISLHTAWDREDFI